MLNSLLHNITTSNIKAFIDDKEVIAKPTLFLRPDGRILTDLTVIKPIVYKNKRITPDTEHLLLRIPNTGKSVFLDNFRKYTFRRKIEMMDLSDDFDHLFMTVSLTV